MVIKGIIDKHFPKGSFHDKRWEIGHPSSDAFREEYKLKPGYLDPNRDFNKPDPEGQEVDKGNRAWYNRVIEARTIGEMR